MSTATAGALMFARFAYPPNALGYCGPDDSDGLLEHVAAGVVDGGIQAAARGFEGAWPYLELIAHSNGRTDPLDIDVVEAYWLGNRLLDHVSVRMFGNNVESRFRPQIGRAWDDLIADVMAGARPHHNFHVFGVYPWLGLIRSGIVDQPLRVLDRCRIRWGRVVEVNADSAVVLSRPLEWADGLLRLGPPRAEPVMIAAAGRRLVGDAHPGDWCALHWDWVCDRLSARQLRSLRHETRTALAIVNQATHPAPASVLA